MENEIVEELYQALLEIKPVCGFPVYTSMDIRDDGQRAASVDVNLFPAGFNNIGETGKKLAGKKMRDFFSAKLLKSSPWKITVVPEAHTNNFGYLENLADILEILELAGAETKILWPGPEIPRPWIISTKSGKPLTYLPASEALENPDALLLNHDLSGGLPKAIHNYQGPIFPHPKLGWYKRKKSSHFEIAEALLKKIAEQISDFDPWFYSIKSRSLGDLDMDRREDIQKVIHEGKDFFKELRAQHKMRGISKDPYIFMKNDAGTYGMGVMSFLNEADLDQAESKIRKKMRIGKESVKISRVIFQEGLASNYNCPKQKAVAEPVVYSVHGSPVGGFYRVQRSEGTDLDRISLNQPGSTLEPLDSPMVTARNIPPLELLERGKIYHFLATVHSIAAALEECP
ncbi:hypothetical protein GW915_09960 [bacterium]|nr:hypothetical protein [bacterium]